MLAKLKTHIQNRFPELQQAKLLLAVSGGIDSIVMLHLFAELKLNISVAHCNFQLRQSESDKDMEFVKSLCLRLGIPFFGIRFDTEQYSREKGQSIQISARILRYEWFDKLLDENKLDYVLTAHHLDDAVETFLINFSRGTGLEGLIGIPEQNQRIIRPMLIFSRDEINAQAQAMEWSWREDRTNAETKYLRNKIRKEVVPIFKKSNPGFLNSFANSLVYLNEANSMLKDASKQYYQEVVKELGEKHFISIIALKRRNNYLAYLHYWLQPYGFKAWSDIDTLVEGATGKLIYSDSHVLLKNRAELILAPKSALETDNEVYYLQENETIKQPITIKNEQQNERTILIDKKIIYVDKDQLKFPLSLRRWREGDCFYPLGMRGAKKLSKFFKDEKYSQIDKGETWILCSENQIVWIVGNRMDDRFKVKSTTKNILKIQLIP
ncbi:tRNA lysidine(34) synthetase TilS [Flavobacterium sp. NKUCC04_CG]|uniref:tRNA lysidine(34) synthetase TilS n=1 Tax=Flavobacterium sp. NKUCC04_CG TaxID=2842121 RepID=UPI001C5B579C|nr:tRNA lysidine(34) synthetase TilS [Flavobacterium sp. NKUCC04_CG]MBW3519291.1 tRNA lysidine(34) synthetase TilS [Flavobacterium sp. NKUCC04_CG]